MIILKTLNRVVPFVLFIAVLIVVFGRALFPPDGYMLFGDDFFRSYGFFRQFFVQSIKNGEIPWWNPYLFSGMPFMANPSVSSLYPVNWVYITLPVQYAYPLITCFHIMLAMAAMFWFCRRAFKPALSPIASWGSAIAFGLSGFLMARVWAGHTEILASVAYLPFVIGMFWKLVESPNWKQIVKAAGILAIQIIAGYQTIALFTLEAVAILGVIGIIGKIGKDGLRGIIRRMVVLLIATVLGLAFSTLQLLPNMEFFRESIRSYDFPYTYMAQGAIELRSLLQFISPFAFGDQRSFIGPPPNYHEQAAHIGITVMILAVFGTVITSLRLLRVLKKKKNEHTSLIVGLVLIALFSIWVALGPNIRINLHAILWQYVPFFKGLRIPARILVLADFSLAALVGLGIQLLGKKLLQIGAVILILTELIPVSKHFIEVSLIPGTSHDKELVKILKSDSQIYRVLPNFGAWVSPRDALDFDAPPVYGIFSATGYDPSIIKTYYEFADASIGNRGSSILTHNVQIPLLDVFSPGVDFLNSKYIINPTAYDPIGWFATERFTLINTSDANGYRLYRNNEVLSRFYLVQHAVILPDAQRVREALRERSVDLRTSVILSQTENKRIPIPQKDCSNSGKNNVEVVSYRLNTITLSVDSPCDNFLVSSEVMYPGWTATVDGMHVPIYTGNLAFRTIYISAGNHTIVYRFIPYIFIWGAAVTAVAVAGCCFMVYYEKYK